MEPPKDFWFSTGRYIPPLFGILNLATFLEKNPPSLEIEVMDCQSEQLDWAGSEKRIESFQPDMAAHERDEKLRKLKTLSRIFTVVSLLSLFLVAASTFFIKTPEISAPKQIVGLVFDSICLMGAVAAVAPSRCSKQLHHARSRDAELTRTDREKAAGLGVTLRGHHATCGQFTSHVLRIGEKIYCAGCLGLFTGALAALTGSLAYFFGAIDLGSQTTLVFWLGFVGVLAGLLQYARPFTLKASVHFILNVVFVLGSFLLFIGVIEMNGNFGLQVYLLAAITYWILTRIFLSNLEHQKTCAVCAKVSCTYY